MRWFAAMLLTIAACSGDDGAASRQSRCERLRDHVIDLRLASVANVDVESHREAMRRALGGDFVASCVAQLSDTQLGCALSATDSTAVAACSKPGSGK
jgi:hypothetical protein